MSKGCCNRNPIFVQNVLRPAGIILPEPPFVLAATSGSILNSVSNLTYADGSGPSNESVLFRIIADGLSPDTDNITVTPSTNFEVYDGTTWQSSPFTIPYTGGEINTSLIYKIRLKAGVSTGNYSEQVTISAPGATDFNINVSGSVTSSIILSIVAAYNLDGSSVDNTGGGNNGFDMNVDYEVGLGGNLAAYYDGVTAKTSFDDSPVFDFGSGDFTIAAFVKREGTLDEIFTGKTIPAGGPENSAFAFGFFGNKLTGFFSDGASYITATSSENTTDTDWHSVIFERDGDTIAVYLDTVQKGTADVTGLTINDTVGGMSIGGFGQFPMNLFTGHIQYVFYWNRALTASEKSELFNSGLGNPYPF